MNVREQECYTNKKGRYGPDVKFCELIFDGLFCWPATRAGEVATQICPYIDHSITTLLNATKKCEENGSWEEVDHLTQCDLELFDGNTAHIPNNDSLYNILIYDTWFPRMKIICHTGYFISIITLLFSIIVLAGIKKLHCGRNILHIHLFVSFLMRATMYIVKELVIHEGVALKSDLKEEGKRQYLTENYNWICKAITSLKYYSIQANFMFILMEGIYLHNLIFLNLFSEKTNTRIYYILGWSIPLMFISIWVKLRTDFEDTMCWTTNKNKYLAMLTQTPIEISILINFILFISITRVLCLKINSMYLKQRRIKYRRLIKSTLTLVLIYGVPYTISVGASYSPNVTVELIWIICDQIFVSFQGLFMALVYCILNGEVRSEIRHKYYSIIDKHRQKRHSRTISNTQQISLQMLEDLSAEPLKINHHMKFNNF